MRLTRYSRLLSVKYATELASPEVYDLSGGNEELVARNNLVEYFTRFMGEFDTALRGIKQTESLVRRVFNLGQLDKVRDSFAELVAYVDSMDSSALIKKISDLVTLTEHTRKELDLKIKTNKEDPAFTGFSERKRLASTVDNVLKELNVKLLETLRVVSPSSMEDIAVKQDLPSPTQMLKSRRTMELTPGKIKELVFTVGEFYGVEDMLDWGRIKHLDPELAGELSSSFIGLNKEYKKFTKQEYFNPKDIRHKKQLMDHLKSRVKQNLKDQVLKLLGRKG